MPSPPRTPAIVQALRLGDLDPATFFLDKASGKVKLQGGQGSSFTAGATISGDTALMFARDGSGTVVPADPTALPYVYAGIALNAGQPGDNIAVAKSGLITAPFWQWTFGGAVFTAANGQLTQQIPQVGLSHIVGVASAAGTILLDEYEVIELGD